MEDDNANDIFKWMFAKSENGDLAGKLQIEYDGARKDAEVKLRGNILAIRWMHEPIEPIVIVMEKVQVKAQTGDEHSFVFVLTYESGSMKFFVENDEDRELWMIKMSTCSHRIAQAEFDVAADAFFNNCTPSVATVSPAANTFDSFFLVNCYKKIHNFSIPQNVGFHSRKIVCEEIMWESKLCRTLPIHLVKLYLKWTSEMTEQLKSRLWALPNEILDALYDFLRHLSENQEIFMNSLEFLEAYSGPSFRSSVEKFRVAFGSVPTNLHLQRFMVDGHQYDYLTAGSASALPLRFSHGGLSRLRLSLHSSLNDPEQIDHILDSRFYHRRQMLQMAKSKIGELSSRIETDWHITSFGSVDAVGVQLLADIKQLHEKLTDLINSFPGASSLVDRLFRWGRAESGKTRLSFRKEGNVISDCLDSQLDNIEASFISLDTKMAVIDSVPDDEDSRKDYEKNAKQTLNSCLDALLQLTESLMDAQLLGLIIALKKSTDCQLFHHIQLRSDLVLSQAITIVVTGLLAFLKEGSMEEVDWNEYAPLVTVFSFLSCYGDEKGMMEDARECWASLHDRVSFKFVLSKSTVATMCVPNVTGDRYKLMINVPLPQAMFQKLPEKIRAGEPFNVNAIFWNLGINHEATFSQTIAGDCSLEQSINLIAARALEAYVANRKSVSQSTTDLLRELCSTVNADPTNKNIAIFRLSMAVNASLCGIPIICCKSGKDRTSMAITYEEGRIIRENCGVSAEQMGEMVVHLRRDGVRRENCRKNVGKALYSFSPFQMHFIPKEFRPPAGTFAQGVAS